MADAKDPKKEPSKELVKPADDFFNVVASIAKTNPPNEQKKS